MTRHDEVSGSTRKAGQDPPYRVLSAFSLWPLEMSLRLIFKLSLFSFLSAAAISALIQLAGDSSLNYRLMQNPPTVLDMVGVIVVAPIIETIFIFLLFLLLRKKINRNWSSYATAVILAAFHAVFSPMWALVIFIPFLAFTYPFRKEGMPVKEAFWLSLLSHMLHNSYAAAMYGLL